MLDCANFAEIWYECLDFRIWKVWQGLCVHVIFPPVFENLLVASGDKQINASDHCVFFCERQNPEWQFGIWFQWTQCCKLSGDGQALGLPSQLPSSSLFHLTHPIFVYNQGNTTLNVFGKVLSRWASSSIFPSLLVVF